MNKSKAKIIIQKEREVNTNRFEPNKLTGYSESDVVEEIRRVVGEFRGEIPNSTQFESVARVGLTTIRRRFGSYKKALERAGFTYTKRCSVSRRKYTDEQVLDNLREVLSCAGGYQFSLEFYRKNGGLFKTRTPIKDILGLSWEKALEKVGAKKRAQVVHVSVHAQRSRFLQKLTPDDLLREIDLAWQEKGRCPTRGEFDRFSKHSKQLTASYYPYRFGSWSNAIEALCKAKGIPIPRIPGTPLTKDIAALDARQQSTYSPRTPITKDDLLAELRSVQRKYPDAQILYKLYKSNGGSYHIDTFRSHFGSWAKAVEAVGGTAGHIRHSNDELFDEMQRVWEQFGRQPTFREMEANGKIGPHTYLRRFGGWIKAMHAFCQDRENDSADPELAESPRIDHSTSETESKETSSVDVSGIVPSTEPVPLIVSRKTGRAVPPRLRFRVFVRDAFTCRACGRSRAKHDVSLEADHIKPYSYPHNGETVFENLQTLCEDCNRGKSNLWAV